MSDTLEQLGKLTKMYLESSLVNLVEMTPSYCVKLSMKIPGHLAGTSFHSGMAKQQVRHVY